MGRKPARRFTAEEKLRILEESRQPKTTVAEVLRRHGLDAATFYRWERLADAGMRERWPSGHGRPSTRTAPWRGSCPRSNELGSSSASDAASILEPGCRGKHESRPVPRVYGGKLAPSPSRSMITGPQHHRPSQTPHALTGRAVPPRAGGARMVVPLRDDSAFWLDQLTVVSGPRSTVEPAAGFSPWTRRRRAVGARAAA
jgi:transposase-like protein